MTSTIGRPSHPVQGARQASEFCWMRRKRYALLTMSAAHRITVDVPAALAGRPVADLADRARFLLVVDEVRSNRMTRAAGARALGMPLDDFLIAAGECGLYAIDYDLEDFRRELDGLPKARD